MSWHPRGTAAQGSRGTRLLVPLKESTDDGATQAAQSFTLRICCCNPALHPFTPSTHLLSCEQYTDAKSFLSSKPLTTEPAQCNDTLRDHDSLFSRPQGFVTHALLALRAHLGLVKSLPARRRVAHKSAQSMGCGPGGLCSRLRWSLTYRWSCPNGRQSAASGCPDCRSYSPQLAGHAHKRTSTGSIKLCPQTINNLVQNMPALGNPCG